MARTRGNGEGSIYQRSDGKWCAAVTLEGARRKVLYGKTRQDVAKKLTVALRDHQQGLPVVTERQTLGQFLDRWLADSVKPTLRPRTHESYVSLVRLHINPTLGKISLAKLSPQDLQALMNAKQASGLSASSVKYLHAVLHRSLGQAFKWGLVARNVATLVDPPRIVQKEVAAFTPEQARQLLHAIRGHRLEALYSVALAVGLRQGEALGLRWSDVDLEAGDLRVRMQLQRLEGRYQLVEPKTHRSRRTIALPALAVEALRRHKVQQIKERLAAGANWDDWGLVFTSLRGTPLDAKNVTHRFQALLKRLELPRMRFHDLRHACATLLLAQEVHPRVVMETLGHSQISMTMNTYSHVIPALQRDAAARLDSLLTGT